MSQDFLEYDQEDGQETDSSTIWEGMWWKQEQCRLRSAGGGHRGIGMGGEGGIILSQEWNWNRSGYIFTKVTYLKEKNPLIQKI